MRPGVREQPDKHDENPSLLKIQKLARSVGARLLIRATQEAEAGELLIRATQEAEVAVTRDGTIAAWATEGKTISPPLSPPKKWPIC